MLLTASRWSDLVNHTKAASHIQEISAAELNTHIQGQNPSTSETAPVIIDVREGSELDLGKIPHAISIPRGILELRIEKVVNVDSNRPIVLYCAGGLRSVMAAEALQRLGYNNEKIKSLSGGFEQWREEGYDIEC
ncbi:Rhodanese-like domain-containing protein [Umbelopsis sp. PMI_123]|nr:Rhodanese-like domain-containing protein [Umbelopsis sp. PMI_123]